MRKSGGWDKGDLYYGKALALNPRHEQAMEYLGEMYPETGRSELARTMPDKLATLCPEGCEARSELEIAFEAYDRDKPTDWARRHRGTEEHTPERQSLMCNSHAVFCLHNKKKTTRLPS